MEPTSIDTESAALTTALRERAIALVVDSPATAEEAAQLLVAISNASKRVEEWFEEPTTAAHRAWKALTTRRTEVLSRFDVLKIVIKPKLRDWNNKIEAERLAAAQEAERLARIAAEAQRMAEAEAAMDAGDLATSEAILEGPAPLVQVPIVPAPEPVKVKGIAFVETWHYEITNFAQLPNQYKMANEMALRKVVAALGAACRIPGIRVWSTKEPRPTGRRGE